MKFFKHIERIFLNKIGITKDIYTLFKLEATLARLNIRPLLLSLSFLIAFVISLWLSLMLLVGDLIFILTNQFLISIIIILIVNLVATSLFILNLKNRLHQMSFSRTRDCLKTNLKRSESESEKGIAKVDNSTGRKD